jgi:outer membrane protein TolC
MRDQALMAPAGYRVAGLVRWAVLLGAIGAGAVVGQDGATQDGATQDGATQDGATQDGATQDGATQDGGSTPTSGGTQSAADDPDRASTDTGDSADVESPASRPEKPRQTIELALQEAVRIALVRNFDVRIARLTHVMSRRDLVVQRAVFDPFFTLNSTYTKNRRPTASFLDIGGGALINEVQVNPFESANYSAAIGGLTRLGTTYEIRLGEAGFDRPLAAGSLFGLNPQESMSASATFTQPLLKGAWYPYNSGQMRIALNSEFMARDDLETATQDLIYRVEAAYWSLVFSTKNLQANSRSLELAREDLSKAQKEEEAGTKARIYVTTVKSQLALREIEYDDGELQRENARDALLQILNHGGDSLKDRWQAGEDGGPYDNVLVIPTTEGDRSEFAPDRNVSLVMAFGNRPDYRRYDFLVDSQAITVDLARNDLWPQLDLTGTWEQLGLDDSIEGSVSSLGSGRFYGWSVGLQLQMPLSNRGPKSIYRREKDRLRQIGWQKIQLENQIIVEIDGSIRRLASLFRKVGRLEQIVQLKEVELNAEKKKLAAGTSIPFTVHTIENDLIGQQAAALQALADYLIAKAEYYKLTGVIFERYGVSLDTE